MAQLMRCTDAYVASRTVKIVSTETGDFTLYVIEVTVGRFSWRVKHRYSEFLEMHERLVYECRLEKDIFPPKKMFGKTSDAFIAKRQAQLEFYIQTVLLYLYSTKQPLPQVLTAFLDFPKYEIHGITEALAEFLYTRGDWFLQNNEVFTVQTLQLHAIHERLKLAEPTCESGDKKKDLGHVLDFVTRVRSLKILGSRDPVWHSNIDMNQLPFDLTIFRNLEALHVVNINVNMVSGVEIVKRTVRKLYVRHSISALEDIMLRDIVDLPVYSQGYLVPAWSGLKLADFSHNKITAIDESVKLMPKVESLSLSHNELVEIQHLACLSNLTHLDLSHNKLRFIDALHTKLGNLKTLNLSGNQISSLQGLSKLYSLEVLDLQSNDITFVLEITHISSLPCLEHLILTGNPITVIVDYRTKVFELFGDRAGELYLDNHKPTQKERDTVAILQAIQKAREGRERAKRAKKATEVTIADTDNLTIDLPTENRRAPAGAQSRDPFRQKVETMRAQVGESWLSLLNEMQEPSDAPGPSHLDAPGTRSVAPAPSSSGRYSSVSCGIPTNQPGISNNRFVQHLHQMLTSLNVSSHIPGITGSPHDRPERVVYVIWCICLPYSQGNSYPACCVLTDEMLHIFRYEGTSKDVTASASAPFPKLSHVYSMVVSNVQEIVVGYRQLHFRIEEAFIGPPGTFAFVTSNPSKTLQFITYLKDTSSINGDEVLIVQDFGDLSERQLLDLLSQNEKELAHIVHYILVQVPVHVCSLKHAIYSVCLTRNYLYLLEVNPVHYPSTTFELVSEGQHFSIVQRQSLRDNVNDVNFTNDQMMSAGDDTPQPVFGLTLIFDGETVFQCVFQAPELRDLFLCQLMQLRRQLAQRQSDERDGQIDGESQTSDRGACGGKESNDSDVEKFREMTVSEYSRLENWHNRPDAVPSHQSTPSHYPSVEFLQQLTVINQNADFIQPMSSALQQLASLDGQEMFDYFHEKIADIGVEGEELRHICWTMVTPYILPESEIISCVLLSTRTVYFISDRLLPTRSPVANMIKTHRRNQSDSLLGQDLKFLPSLHHRSGVIHLSTSETQIARCYAKVNLTDLCCVNINLEDSSFRLTTDSPETTFTLLTRYSEATNPFIRALSSVLCHLTATSPEYSSSDSEQDFYKIYDNETKTRKVDFQFANDDKSDLKFTVAEKLSLDQSRVEIVAYLLVFEITEPDTIEHYDSLQPKTLVLCSSHMLFINEDYINYPIPDFVRFPPRKPRHEVMACRGVEYLKRITVSDFTSNDMTMIFTDMSEVVDVDPSYEHYSADLKLESESAEVKYTFLFQSIHDKNRLLSLLSEEWSKSHQGHELSIQVNA